MYIQHSLRSIRTLSKIVVVFTVACVLLFAASSFAQAQEIESQQNDYSQFLPYVTAQRDSYPQTFPNQGFAINVPGEWVAQTGSNFFPGLPPDTVSVGDTLNPYDIILISVDVDKDFPQDIKTIAFTMLRKYLGDIPRDSIVYAPAHLKSDKSIRTMHADDIAYEGSGTTRTVTLCEFAIVDGSVYWIWISFYAKSGSYEPLTNEGRERMLEFERIIEEINITKPLSRHADSLSVQNLRLIDDFAPPTSYESADLRPFTWQTSGYIKALWGAPINGGHHHRGIDIWSSKTYDEWNDRPGPVVSPVAPGKITIYYHAGGTTDGIRIYHGKIDGKDIYTHYWHLASVKGDGSMVSNVNKSLYNNMYVTRSTVLGRQGNHWRVDDNEAYTRTTVHSHLTVSTKTTNWSAVDPTYYFGDGVVLKYGAKDAIKKDTYVTNGIPVDPPPAPNKTIVWDFDKNNGGTQGWNEKGWECQDFWHDGFWGLDPRLNGDPWIVNDYLNADSTKFYAIQIRMATTADGIGTIFWATDKSPHYTGNKSRNLPLKNDGKWRTITVRLDDHPDWKGKITGLRIDPSSNGQVATCGTPSDNVMIDWVKLLYDDTPPLDAAFVRQSVPTKMVVGKTYDVSVTFKNTGTSNWLRSSNVMLGSQNAQDNNRWGLGRVKLATTDTIKPGQQKTFNFKVTAPSTPGNYNFQWKMLREGATWFGVKSTNVVVQVDKPALDASFVKQSVPATMVVGQKYDVSVTYKNTGNNTWTRALEIKLGSQNPTDNNRWGVGRVLLSSTNAIKPGQQNTFKFKVTAPSKPGTYDFRWRMMRELVAWFGPLSPNLKIKVIAPPAAPTLTRRGCAATSNVWQNACNDMAFTWSPAVNSSKGVKDYLVYWGKSASGAPNQVVKTAAFNPGPVPSGRTYYLRVRARDSAGNRFATKTLYVLRFDNQAPGNPTTINPGCTALHDQWQSTCDSPVFTWSGANDAGGSGVSAYRVYWGESATGAPTTPLSKASFTPSTPAQTLQPAYLRIQAIDKAGNVSAAKTLFTLKYEAPPSEYALSIRQGTTTVATSETFSVNVRVQAPGPVDGAAAYIDFDPSLLQVVSLASGGVLDSTLQNSYDNSTGRINFAAGTLNSPLPSGNFTLVTIQFTAQTASPETQLVFATSSPRVSDITANGASVLQQLTGGAVVVMSAGAASSSSGPASSTNRVHLPQIIQSR